MTNSLLPCGHHSSLLVKSVESNYQFCELCECRKERNDALEMERTYQQRAEQAEQDRDLAIKGSANQMVRAEALQDKLDMAEAREVAMREALTELHVTVSQRARYRDKDRAVGTALVKARTALSPSIDAARKGKP